MVRNLLKSLAATMVFFAGLHLLILGAMALIEEEASYLNIFNILGIQEYLPEQLSISPLSDFASVFVMGLVFIFFFATGKKNS